MTYAVSAIHHFYSNTLNVQSSGVLHDHYDDSLLAFAAEADALALAKMLNDTGAGPSILSHGQYAPSEYRVTKSSAPSHHLPTAMTRLGLQYDFNLDGTRKAYDYGH